LQDIPPNARRPIELVIGDIHRLRRMVEELLELARLDSRQDAVATEVLSLPAVVDAVRRGGHWDNVVLDVESVWVLADRRRVERVVANLFSNAAEHGGANATARVFRTERWGVLEVHDDGPGVRPEHRAAIFDRFFKADGSRSRPGAGLGLAIAAEHAGAMGGSLTLAESTPESNQGTTFVLQLPLASREAAQLNGATPPRGALTSAGSGRPPPV